MEAELQFAQQKVAELQEQEQSMKKQHPKRVKKKQPLMSEDDDENMIQELPKRKARRKSITPTKQRPPVNNNKPQVSKLSRTLERQDLMQEYKILDDLKREIAQEQHDVRKMMNELISQLKHRKHQRLEHERSLKASSEFIYS